jgi:hypothetical protein
MRRLKGVRSADSMVLQVIDVGERHYELRYNRCGKSNCRVCVGAKELRPGPPGHGPYWYLCFTASGCWVRLYLGKELDTKRWVTAEGQVDYAAYKAEVRRRQVERRAKTALGDLKR